MIVRAGDGSMHSLEVEWLLARLLARLVGSAWLALAWLVTIDAAKIQPIRRRNEDESTDGLGLKIDSISKAPRGMYDATYVRYVQMNVNVCASQKEINSQVVGNYGSSLRIVSSSALRAKGVSRQCEKTVKG